MTPSGTGPGDPRHGDGPWQGGPWHGGGPWQDGEGPRRGTHRHPSRARYAGCFVVFVVLVASLVLALVGWAAALLVSLVLPIDVIGPPAPVIVAVAVALVLLLVAGSRVFGSAVRPLAELADATDRLADGEPGVRVRPRGPRAVRRLAASFNTMAERLDRSRDDRRAMLADVSHELRTPMTVIQGGLEAMVDGIHPYDEDHVAPLLAEAEVMGRLLEDLRTLSLTDAGALTLHREPSDLVAVAREVAIGQGPVARAKGVELEVTGDGRLVASVDPVRFREVVTNLVANALRHTPAGGGVEVDVRRVGDEARLVVRDTGEGIAPDELSRVFDRFQRRSDTGGSGLGLAIVRDLVLAHGGTVTAESEGLPGRGATFRVALPIRD